MDNQMILHLRPTCSKCGEKIKPWYFSGEMFVAGKPQFGGWDWKNHICRLGLVWMIERKDNNHWLSENDTWTTDPTESKIFKTRNDAVLYKINNISLKLDCVFTEHEYSNKLWDEAHLLTHSDPSKSQTEHYMILLNRNK